VREVEESKKVLNSVKLVLKKIKSIKEIYTKKRKYSMSPFLNCRTSFFKRKIIPDKNVEISLRGNVPTKQIRIMTNVIYNICKLMI
jgi:hypothetical protein